MIMTKEEEKKTRARVEETARLLKENPTWSYKQAIEKAKELIK